jgi:hypothetical protein
MTAWQSMFDGGACMVSVSDNYAQNPLWSDTLAKGGASPIFAATAGGNLAVAVDANGIVSLSSPDGTVTAAAGIKVIVAPQYDVSALATRAIGISVPGSPNSWAWADVANQDGDFLRPPPYGFATRVTLDPTTGAATPSEVDFSAIAGAVSLLYAEEGF